MRLDFNDMLFAISDGLDCVERGLVGVANHHSRRVAYLVARMAKADGTNELEALEMAACGLLHDNALTEYIQEEFHRNNGKVNLDKTLGVHCTKGEENLHFLPFETDVTDYILYHHENADGTGPFGKKAEETPFGAQIIHLADILDVSFHLDCLTQEKWKKIEAYFEHARDSLFSGRVTDLFFKAFPYEELARISGGSLDNSLRAEFPEHFREYDGEQIRSLARMFAKIIDYKSEFTGRHSLGIAEKAEQMGEFYGYDAEVKTKLYLAGALHDIGKLIVDTEILEKPDKLTAEEYRHIQNHAMGTYVVLSQIKGLEDVTSWASLHHEKLNGKGYPFGKTADELGKQERLMACLDIYQALTESRPYKEGMSHERSIGILKGMCEKEELDKEIIDDMDTFFCRDSMIEA